MSFADIFRVVSSRAETEAGVTDPWRLFSQSLVIPEWISEWQAKQSVVASLTGFSCAERGQSHPVKKRTANTLNRWFFNVILFMAFRMLKGSETRDEFS